MRVIGGELRHRKLEAPAGLGTRPSADRLRETLFNILGPAIAGHLFVDLYAGTGAVGIEAYSRGARPVVWVERTAAAARVLRANLRGLGIGESGVAQRDVGAVLRGGRWPGDPETAAACIFLDPPYGDESACARVLAELDRHPELAGEGARVVAETRRNAELPETVGRWRRQRVHALGDSQLVFYALDERGAPRAARL